MAILNTLDENQLDALERRVYGIQLDADAETIELCIRKGILVQTDETEIDFSSPILWRYFVKMRIGHIERPVEGPRTLPNAILRTAGGMNSISIRQSLGTSLSNDIPLERAWQMEFYKAAHRSTPANYFTSAALFGSKGFIDFTIHHDDFWVIELLREANSLEEHIQRFAADGKYASIQFSDFCLLDFRRVSSIDKATPERLLQI